MTQEQVSKVRKKQWFNIVAPPTFSSAVIGETLVYEPASMIGKTLRHSLMNLTNDMKKQHINIHFKVTDVENGQGKTRIIGYEVIPSSVKRFVRRNSEKLDMSFVVETADNMTLRIKPLVVTKSDVKGSIASRLRKTIHAHLARIIKKMKFDELMNELISHKIQSEMRAMLNKIYPLKVCEIRYVGIEQTEKPKEDAAEVAQ